MPRYYFDINDGNVFYCDEFGDEFDSFEEVIFQAKCLVTNITREQMPNGDLHQVSCDTRDETDKIVYRGKLTYHGTRV